MATVYQDRNLIFATSREFQKLSRVCGETFLHIENAGNKSWMNFSALLPSSPQKKEESLFNSNFSEDGLRAVTPDCGLIIMGIRLGWLHFSTTLSKPVGVSSNRSTIKKAKSPRKIERDNARAAALNECKKENS